MEHGEERGDRRHRPTHGQPGIFREGLARTEKPPSWLPSAGIEERPGVRSWVKYGASSAQLRGHLLP